MCFHHSLLQPQNRQVAQTLGVATACMFTLPLIAFFLAQYYFREKAEPDSYAAAAAVLAVNVVVAGYCIKAFREDREEEDHEKTGDADGPRVGAFKERTD